MSLDLFEILSKSDLSKHFDYIYFDISETSMSHRFAIFSGGSEGLSMNVWDSGSNKDISGDNFLNIQNDEDVFLHVFPRAVREYLPKPFNDIDLSTKINRYLLVPSTANTTSTEIDRHSKNAVIPEKRSIWKRLLGRR